MIKKSGKQELKKIKAREERVKGTQKKRQIKEKYKRSKEKKIEQKGRGKQKGAQVN